MSESLEIVGLHSDTNGGSRISHAVHGNHLKEGDILRLASCIVECHGKMERAIKCMKVVDGINTCTVACVSCNHMTSPKVWDHLNEFVQVSEIHASSKNSHKWSNKVANHGVALVKILAEDNSRNK